MLFQAMRSGFAVNVRAGVKEPAGLDCAGSEPREKSARAPISSDSKDMTMWSEKYEENDRTSPRESSGVLNSITNAGALLAVTWFISEGAVKRLSGSDVFHPPPATI